MTSPNPGSPESAQPQHAQLPAGHQVPHGQSGQVPGYAPVGQPGGPASPSTSGRGITVWHVLTGVLAVACVVLAVLLVIPGTGGQVGASARTSAAAACDLIHQVPEDGVDSESEEAYAMLYVLSGAQVLAELAAEQDESYAELRDAMYAPRAVQAATFSMDSAEFIEALDDARAAC